MAVALFIAAVPLHAQQHAMQEGSVLYHSIRLPQSNIVNPAFFPDAVAFISLPTINPYISMPFSYKELDLKYDPDRDATLLNLNHVGALLKRRNIFRAGINLDIIALGYRYKGKNCFTFSLRNITSMSLTIPNTVVDAMNEGNAYHTGSDNQLLILDGDVGNIQSYAEIAVGYHRIINRHWQVGGKFKWLQGIMNVNTDDLSLRLYTSEDYSTLQSTLDYNARMSGIFCWDSSKLKLERGVPNNTGWAIDLGGMYKIKGFTFSASILDLSPGIHWRSHIYKLTPKSGHNTITYSGMDLRNTINYEGFDSTFIGNVGDTLLSMVDPEKVSGGDYWYPIPTKFNIGASWSFRRYFRVGLLYHGEFERGLITPGRGARLLKNGRFRHCTTLSFSGNLYNWFEVTVGTSMVSDGVNFNPFNPGIAISFTPKNVAQLSLVCDYISSLRVVKMRDVNVRLQFSLLLGKTFDQIRKERKEKEEQKLREQQQQEMLMNPDAERGEQMQNEAEGGETIPQGQTEIQKDSPTNAEPENAPTPTPEVESIAPEPEGTED